MLVYIVCGGCCTIKKAETAKDGVYNLSSISFPDCSAALSNKHNFVVMAVEGISRLMQMLSFLFTLCN